jgi:hypothetical protein
MRKGGQKDPPPLEKVFQTNQASWCQKRVARTRLLVSSQDYDLLLRPRAHSFRHETRMRLKQGTQKVVPIGELEEWIEQGWDCKRDLPDQKVVIGLRPT